MTGNENAPAGRATGRSTGTGISRGYRPHPVISMAREFLLALLDGARFATAIRADGRPAPIRLPDDPSARAALIRAHLAGLGTTLTFVSSGRGRWTEAVEHVVLAALCPSADALARWLGIDFDAADHGSGGLADPVHATRCLAERADAAGLSDGLIVCRSKGGAGRHCWIVPPTAVSVDDAALVVAMLAAMAFTTADRDARDAGAPSAFRTANGGIARPGDAGAVELIPRSDSRPALGWALTLPMAGAFRERGGGVILDPFDDCPITLTRVPRCDATAWETLIREARALDRTARVKNAVRESTQRPRHRRTWARPRRSDHRSAPTLDRVDPRTRDFIEGRTPEGGRNAAAYAAACNLIGNGFTQDETARLIIDGAERCGLPEREVRDILKSARRAVTGGGR